MFRVACKGCDYNWAGEVISLLNMSSPVTHSLHTASVSFFYAFFVAHGSYNLEKVLNFTSRREKSLESVEVLEKYLISLLGLGTSLKFTTLTTPRKIWLILCVRTSKTYE